MRIIKRTGRKTCAAVMLAAACVPSARAATKTWDLDAAGHNNSVVDNGSGVWNDADSNWTLDTGANNVLWSNNDDAVFGGNPGTGAAGTINISGNVYANSITFSPVASGNFLLSGVGTLNLTGPAMIIRNAAATINTQLSGSAGLNKSGTMPLTLTGNNTVSGAVVMNGGTTILSGASGGLNTASSYTLNAATLRMDNSLAAGGNHATSNRMNSVLTTLNSGTIDLITNGTNTTELAGNLTAATGASVVSLSGSGTANLIFGTFVRNPGATLQFVGADSNRRVAFTSGFSTGAFKDQGTFVNGEYAVYDSGGFLREMQPAGGPNDSTNVITTDRHVRLDSAQPANVAAFTIKTLHLAGATIGLDLNTSTTYKITNGGIIKGGGGASTIGDGNNNTVITTDTPGVEWVIRTINLSDVLTINEKVVGSAGLTKTGPGTLIFSGNTTNSSWPGATSVVEGTLKLGASNTLPDAAPMVVTSGATFDMNVKDATVGSLTLTDGKVVTTGAPTLKLNGNTGFVTYNGKTTGSIVQSHLNLASITTAATHVFDIGDGAAAVDLDMQGVIENTANQAIDKQGLGTLRLGAVNAYTGATNITAGTLQLDGSLDNSSTVNIGANGTLTGTFTTANTAKVNGSATITGNGVVNFSNSGATGSLIVGTLNATGGNWKGQGGVTGITTVGNGTFTVNGNMGGAGALNVTGATAKLAGTGTVSKNVTIASVNGAGGTISPGGDGTNSTVAAIATGASGSSTHTWGQGSTYIWEIKDATGSAGNGYDTVNVTGALSVTATNASAATKMTIKIVTHGALANFNQALGNWSWIIASGTSVTGFAADKFILDTTDFADDNDCTASLFQVTNVSNTVRIVYVPEPASTLMLGGMGAVGLLSRRRRRKA